MAVEFKVEHTRTSEYLIAPKDIKFKAELNGRHDLPDIEGLIASMVKVGQIQPVLVRNDGGTPVLVAGFSRWRAAIEINKRKLTPKPIKLRCVSFRGSEQQGMLANIAENRERNSTTKLDDGYNICRLERYGMTLEEIAEEYGEDVRWVKNRQALVSLAPEAQAAVKGGKVKPSAVRTLSKLSEEEQRRAIKEAEESGETISNRSLKPVSTKLSALQIVQAVADGEKLPFEYIGCARTFCEAAMEYLRPSKPAKHAPASGKLVVTRSPEADRKRAATAAEAV